MGIRDASARQREFRVGAALSCSPESDGNGGLRSFEWRAFGAGGGGGNRGGDHRGLSTRLCLCSSNDPLLQYTDPCLPVFSDKEQAGKRPSRSWGADALYRRGGRSFHGPPRSTGPAA